MNENERSNEPKINDNNETQLNSQNTPTDQEVTQKTEGNSVLNLKSSIEIVSQTLTENLFDKNNDEKDNKENLQPDESPKQEISDDRASNLEQETKISIEIENIVQNITDRVISAKDESHENTDVTEDNQKQDIKNSKDIITEPQTSEINTIQLENFSNNLIQKILPTEEEESADTSSKPSQNNTNTTITDISNEISEPRTVIRRQYEKSDASVQFESTDDSIFATSIDSPRVQSDTNEDDNKDTNDSESPAKEDQENTFLPSIPISLFSDEELHSALNTLIKTKKLPPQEMREELISFARKQSLYKLMSEDYDSAAKIDEAVEQIINSLHEETVNNDISNQTYNLQQYLNEATIQKVHIEENHKQRIDQFKKMEQRKIEEVRLQHENQRRDFEADWSREDALKPFNKPSPKLFQLRRQQKAMAISHDFKNARQLKKLGDQLQKEESQIATKKAVETMRSKYIALLARQEKEMRCMLEYGERRLGQLEAERDVELKANETHINALQNRINNPKIQKRPRVQIPQSSLKSRSLQNQVAGIVTSRTRSQFANFKKDSEIKTRLDIKLGDVRRITKPLTPTPRKGDKTIISPFT